MMYMIRRTIQVSIYKQIVSSLKIDTKDRNITRKIKCFFISDFFCKGGL